MAIDERVSTEPMGADVHRYRSQFDAAYGIMGGAVTTGLIVFCHQLWKAPELRPLVLIVAAAYVLGLVLLVRKRSDTSYIKLSEEEIEFRDIIGATRVVRYADVQEAIHHIPREEPEWVQLKAGKHKIYWNSNIENFKDLNKRVFGRLPCKVQTHDDLWPPQRY
jgi:hypothetical protein